MSYGFVMQPKIGRHPWRDEEPKRGKRLLGRPTQDVKRCGCAHSWLNHRLNEVNLEMNLETPVYAMKEDRV